jgi:hypothetical protein
VVEVAVVEVVVVVVAVVVVPVSLDLRLVFDALFRIEGISNDSLAFGSSNFVYLPIEGLLITCSTTTISHTSGKTNHLQDLV